MPQDGFKTAPRWPKMALRWPQNGSRQVQDRPKMSQDGFKQAKMDANWPNQVPREAQDRRHGPRWLKLIQQGLKLTFLPYFVPTLFIFFSVPLGSPSPSKKKNTCQIPSLYSNCQIFCAVQQLSNTFLLQHLSNFLAFILLALYLPMYNTCDILSLYSTCLRLVKCFFLQDTCKMPPSVSHAPV